MLTVKDDRGKQMLIHVRARKNHPAYEKEGKDKFPVPDDKCLWSASFPSYKPTEFTHPRILSQPPYADPLDPKQIDWSARRFSLEYERQGCAEMQFDDKGRPINPIGRTGMSGRGRMGKWGPNQAADMLVSRKRSDVVEFVAIQRSDTGIWALAGGMVDKNESFKHAAVREFLEEAASSVSEDGALAKRFSDECRLAYSGYVDDNRATDNAWTETQLFHFDATDVKDADLPLTFSDDAIGVRWMRVDDPIFNNAETFHGHHREMILNALKAQ